MMVSNAINPLVSITSQKGETGSIPHNVTELLQELIEESTRQVGKPVPLMTRDDKIRAIKFLNDHGALLITKAGDKISKYFASPSIRCTVILTAVMMMMHPFRDRKGAVTCRTVCDSPLWA